MRVTVLSCVSFLLATALVVSVAVSPLRAQMTSATISGTVTDEAGLVIPGAVIIVTHKATGATRTITTDERGRYVVPGLPPGGYAVRTEREGFQVSVREGIELAVGSRAVIDVSLSVGAMTEQVVVTAEVPLVDTTSATMAGLVDEESMRTLPLNARSFVQLTTLETGVQEFKGVGEPTTTFPGSGRGIRIAINGARPEFNNYLIDGIDAGDAYNNSPGSAAGLFLGVETLREFQVLTNAYNAEFGRVGGGIINAVSRSGENQFHGTLFEFHRNDNLDARNFFDGTEAPEFKRNQFGGVISGPIVEDQTFFLFSYEALRERLGKTILSVVPDDNARTGLLPDPNVVQPNDPLACVLIDPGVAGVATTVQPFLNQLYNPANRDPRPCDGVGEFAFVFKQPTDEDFISGRIDHKISESDSIFVRYTFDDAEVLRPITSPQFAVSDNSQNQYLTAEWVRIISPTVLNTFRFGYNRSEFQVLDVQTTPVDPALSFNPTRDFGTILVGGLSPMGITTFGPNTSPTLNLLVFSDNVIWTRGAHSIKFGVNIKQFRINEINSLADNGLFNFFSLTDFLNGEEFAFLGLDPLASDPISTVTREVTNTLFGFFVQDDFRLAPNFTLNLGVRYEFITVPKEKDGQTANLRNPLVDTALTVGDPVIDNPSLGNIAPRVGFAWDLFGNGKTALRGGGGIYYHQLGWNMFFRTFQFSPPFGGVTVLPGFLPFVNFPIMSPAVLPPRPPVDLRNVIFPTEFNIQQPTVYQYNLNIQHEILPDTVITVGYVGSRGTNLGRPTELNTFAPTTINGQIAFPVPHSPVCACVPPPPRVNPAWVSINQIDTGGNSYYNSLQISVNKRFSGNFQFQLSYTYSHSIDDAPPLLRDVESSASIVMDATDRQRDRGNSNFDIRQNLTFNYIYSIPYNGDTQSAKGKFLSGWEISSITTIKDGTPFTVENGFDRASSGKIGPFLTDRPNLAPGADNNPILGGPDQYFDPSAFLPQDLVLADGTIVVGPAQLACFFDALTQCFGTYGSLGRNTLTGPGLVNFDISLIKDTKLSEEITLQVRSEFFNIFNRTNFATPTGPGRQAFVGAFPAPGALPVPNPVAGRIFKTVTTSRQIQFGIKLIF